jgi:hypothetical protein
MYRPWGLLDWSLGITSQRKWLFVGALGAEGRSLAAWQWLRELGHEQDRHLVEIEPIGPSRFHARTIDRLEKQRQAFNGLNGKPSEITQVPLLTELHRIDAIAAKLEQQSPSIILDISCLPKRFFFPFLRSFYKCDTVRDLVLTYTLPGRYDLCLTENAGPWEHLPGFPGAGQKSELLIVSVGFLVESLQQNLSSLEDHKAIQLLIPFPAAPSSVRRSWQALYNIRAGPRDPLKFTTHRIGAADISGTFDLIKRLAASHAEPASFAPFGPKPMSAAMCLYATQNNSAVYYPQPRYYNPDYSVEVACVHGKRLVYAYWIKHDGTSLYG